MGADMLLTYSPYPHDGKGNPVVSERNEEVIAEGLLRLKALSDGDVRDAVEGSVGPLDMLLDPPGDGVDEDSYYISYARKRAAEAIRTFVQSADDSREVALFVIEGKPFLFTGGMSWGDTPSEIYDDINIVGSLGIYQEAV